MEGGVLFLSLFTLVKLLNESTANHFAVGILVLLVGLSRPEIGLIAIIATALIYFFHPKVLARIMLGLVLGFIAYSVVMLILGVYPIPSTIWSKQITGKLKLFTDKNLIEILPMSINQLMGLNRLGAWGGGVLILLPATFSIALRIGAIPVLSAITLLVTVASQMPGNFVWYSENVFITLLAIMAAVQIAIWQRGRRTLAAMLGVALLVAFSLPLFANFGKNKNYPWNEHSPAYLAYRALGKSAADEGKYSLTFYSNEPVRVRMCEIGIVSFFSGPNAWIYDVCGLAQIGNLKGASGSWLRHFYPASFGETGDEQLARLKDNRTTPVIDVWALRAKEEGAAAVGKCKYVDDKFCINEYK